MATIQTGSVLDRTVLKEGQNPTTIGSDVDALEAHVSTLPQPFGVPADFGHRITKQG